MQDLYTLAQLAALLPQAQFVGEGPAEPVHTYLYDTRHLVHPQGTVFLALVGELRDGHQFVQAAYDAGVRHFWLSQVMPLPGANQLVVPDVLAALQQVAALHRRQFHYPVVAITGSNGKTIVKEWLASLLEGKYNLVKSPRSHNSQLGVALSLLELRSTHELAIIEAGISQVGEMQRLWQMIQPTHGILTHLGDAHAEGFTSLQQKLQEKLRLFQGVNKLICTADDPQVLVGIAEAGLRAVALTVGQQPGAHYAVQQVQAHSGWQFRLADVPYALPLPGAAALENAGLAIAAALLLGAAPPLLQRQVGVLQPVSMRTEMITDNPAITIINDAYNADAASVRNALSLLLTQREHPSRRLVLTDLEHQGAGAQQLQSELLALAVAQLGPQCVAVVGPLYQKIATDFEGVQAYADTDSLIAQFDYQRYAHSAVLLKGARKFQLERLIPLLSQHPGSTYLKVNINALLHNLHAIQRLLPRSIRMMVMLKAAAYGSGSWQLAQALQREGVHHLGVAHPYEGIALRQRGIHTPILVMNADAAALPQLMAHNLEPAIWSLALLAQYAELAAQQGSAPPIHLEFDSGMARLGFALTDVDAVLALLAQHPQVQVASVFTHLAASEDEHEDAFTEQQLQAFMPVATKIKTAYPNALAHALNTGGILRWPHYALDMVRLGIGLYGIAPVPQLQPLLQEVGSLHTQVSQLHSYPVGTSVGYNRTEVLSRAATIATLPIGYADGIARSAGGRRFSVLVRGQLAPVVGRVCMDMLMADVTDIADVQVGDEVVIFGAQENSFQSVNVLAQAMNTIAYEVLAGISSRVRRVYVRE